MPGEFELIEWIKKQQPDIPTRWMGIGDDAALWSAPGGKAGIFSTDTVVDGVDFILGKVRPGEAGHKALAVNLSDLAAMGANPSAYLLTLGVPASVPVAWVKKFCSGVFALASQYKIPCLGGDLSRCATFFASVTVMGSSTGSGPIHRSGAKPGDWLAVTGSLGGSLAGRHLKFQPRIEAGCWLSGKYRPHAMLDISDGLLQDLGHMLRASSVGAELALDEIPVSSLVARRSKGDTFLKLKHALTDGEDFELLMAVDKNMRVKMAKAWKKKFPDLRLSWIGRILEERPGIRMTGARVELCKRLNALKGYRHF